MANDNRFKRFFRDKGFYLVAAVCILGASGAAWVTAAKTLDGLRRQEANQVERRVSGEEKKWNQSSSLGEASPAEEQAGQLPLPSSSSGTADTSRPQSGSAGSEPPAEQNRPEPAPPAVQPPASSGAPESSSGRPPQSGSSGERSSASGSSGARQPRPASQALPYTLPMESLAVINPYSNGELVKNKTLNVWRTHDAVDLQGEKGSKVMAAADGTVLSILSDPLWGGIIEIKHSDGVVTSYSGVEPDKSLKKGASVKGGQKIGTLGEIPAEISAPAHLHFSMKKDGSWLNPGDYLNLK